MFTTGSKVFFGIGAFAFVVAVLYGIATNTAEAGLLSTLGGPGAVDALVGPLTLGWKGGVGDHYGYVTLVSIAAAAFGLGGMSLAFRDGNAESIAQVEVGPGASSTDAPAHRMLWPMIAAVGASCVALGLATSAVLVAVGVVIGLLAALEWLFGAWSEHLSGDAQANAVMRRRLMWPLEIPIAGLLLAGVLLFLLSRIFLALNVAGAVAVAGVLAAAVIAVAFLAAYNPESRRLVLTVAITVVAVAVLAGGIVAAIVGPAPVPEHGSGHTGEDASGEAAAPLGATIEFGAEA